MISENTPQWKVRFFVIVSLLILASLVVSFLYFAPQIEPVNDLDLQDFSLPIPTAVQIDPLVSPAGPILPPIEAIDPILGNSDAAVTIIYFSDFGCPFCKEMKNVWQQVMTEYEGNVRIIWKDLIVYPSSLGLHKGARCAQLQGVFWEYYDLVWDYDFGGSASAGLIDISNTIGLDREFFTQCLVSSEIKKVVLGASYQSISVGIGEVPSYFINDEFYDGYRDIEEIRGIIDEQLGK